MAKIEELINQVTEPRLRAEIAAEVKKLKAQKKFGLVFEEHLPETVRLPGFPITPGELVVQKASSGNDLWLVKKANSRTASCVRPDGTYTAEQRDFPIKDLVVVKRFGEPVYPALVPLDRVSKGGPDKPCHTLISADNFHALQLLLYCYEGQVDVIYIDPPYNTGARDWKYNNDYVDQSDAWRHSKWLSMIKKRLLLAQRLLKKDGVLIVTIDDNEMHHLQMLLESLFPEREVTVVAIVHNPRGNISNNFAYTHEYALYMIPKGMSAVTRTAKENISPRKLRRWGHNSTRLARPTMFYPIYVKNGEVVGVGDKPEDDFHPESKNVITESGEIAVWPIDQNGIERRWNFGLDTINDELDRIVAIQDDNDETDLYISEEDTVPKTVWVEKAFEAGKHGASLVKTILGYEFPFPKSVYAVKHCIDLITRERKNALILDFFAGSGTTLHATCMLNADDEGQRRCILVTNNELNEKIAKREMKLGHFLGDPEFEKHGIAESVTWPRCKYVINGKRDDGTELPGAYLNGRALRDGFEENMEYFKLDFLDPNAVSMGQAFEAILPILWMKAGCFGGRESSRGSKPWFLPKNSPYAVLIKEQEFPAFRKELKGRKDITHVFFVTDSEENFQTMSNSIGLKVETVQLYRSYLENFRINTKLPGLL